MALGINGFYDYQDTFSLGGFGNYGYTGRDKGNLITISCKTKGTTVYGYLSENIKIDGQAKWKEMFGGGIMALGKGAVQIGSNIAQLKDGVSIQQPWMNRKYYESTSPFSFTFGINFVSKTDNQAYSEVYAPAQYLLSLIYPRSTDNRSYAKDALNAMGINTKAEVKHESGKGTRTLVNAVTNAVTDFVIPGPSIAFTNEGETASYKGDAVTIVIGQAFAFGGVYLEDVGVEMSKSFDSSGYPLYARCTVKATCMDVNFCNSDGTFLISQYGAGQYEAISNLIDSIEESLEDTKQDVTNFAKAIGTFWSGKKLY